VRMPFVNVLLTAGVTTIAVLATACSSSGDATSGAGTSGAAGGKYGAGKKIILDTLYRAPLAQNEAAGANLAASEAGAKVIWVGPADINPPAAIKALQDAVAAGADGAMVAAFPGDLFRVPINQAGMPVTTMDLYSPGSKAATHLGPDKYQLGASLAKDFAKALPTNASGEIVGGICVPGLPALRAPQQGFIDTLKTLQPGVRFKADVPTDGDPTKNYTSWQRIMQQNPNALGFIGQCDQDVPNLIKLRKQSPSAKWLIGATSGDSVENIAAVQNGTMVAIQSQNGWPEGYLSAKLLLQHIVKKTPLPSGWIDTGFTDITKDNAAEVTARIKDPSLNAAAFKDLIDKVLADPAAAAKPYDGCRGCGTTFKTN